MALTQNITPVAPPASVPETTGATSTADTDTRAIKEVTSSYTIDVAYRLSNIPVVDAHIQTEVQKAVDAFKKDAAGYDPTVETHPYAFSGTISDYYSDATIVSERIDLYEDTGGAHGLPIVLTLNYDAKTGETITLDRALSMIGLSLKDVASQSLAQLKQQYGDAIIAPSGADPKPANYASFVIGPYNVTFVFGAYQVVAYAAGMPEVKFVRK